MTKYYFTTDFDYTIPENAIIEFVEAGSVEEAKALILAEMTERFPDLEEEGQTLDIDEGGFGDCWFKAYEYSDAKADALELSPFLADDLHVAYPGTHPGGKCHWISPMVTIYVPKIMEIK